MTRDRLMDIARDTYDEGGCDDEELHQDDISRFEDAISLFEREAQAKAIRWAAAGYLLKGTITMGLNRALCELADLVENGEVAVP